MQEQGKKLIKKCKVLNKKNRELTKMQNNLNELVKNLSMDMAKMVGKNRELEDKVDKLEV